MKRAPSLTGYRRKNGAYGIRNYTVILSAVHCANTVAQQIAQRTGTIPVTHDRGCIEPLNSHELTFQALARAGQHPNVGGALVVSLGCEQTDSEQLVREIALCGTPVERLVIQDEGGVREAVEKGVEIAEALKAGAEALEREPMPMDRLVIGTQCGGSDWTTALSGNTVIGAMSELAVAQGCAVMLSEIGGLPGSEHILAENAVSHEVGMDIFALVDSVRMDFLRESGVSIESVNPTVGNKQGGITTLVEKSMGNIKKIGRAPVQGIVRLGEPVLQGGAWVLDNRGNGPDSVNLTGFGMSGVHITVFSSGRGTPIGNALMPVIKLTGNPGRYETLRSLFDFNAGRVLAGESVEAVGEELLELVVETALGRQTISEKNRCFEYTIPHRYS